MITKTMTKQKKSPTDTIPARCPSQKLIDQFLQDFLLERGASRNTIASYERDLRLLCHWLTDRSVVLAQAKREDLLDYVAMKSQEGAKSATTARLLSSLRRFYHYLIRQKVRHDDPTARIELPRIERILPEALTEEEVDSLLKAPKTVQPLGLRDRAMLEVLYATGLRVSELISLRMTDLFLDQGIIQIKGIKNKPRLVPLGEEALHWVQHYLHNARPTLLEGKGNDDYVFITTQGTSMTRQMFWMLIQRYAAEAGIKQHVSPHTLRHAFANHLLKHGADLRVVQLLLGHSDLSTTQIYQQVNEVRLQEMHRLHHPRA